MVNKKKILKKHKAIYFLKLAFSIAVFLIVIGGVGAIALGTADSVSNRIFGIFFYLLIFTGGILILQKSKKKWANLHNTGAIFFADEKNSEKATDIKKTIPPSECADEYTNTLVRIHKLNENILNEDISEKISRIELITTHIFEIIEREPEKSSKVNMFVSYYLPTTLKLLDKYSQYEEYGTSQNVSDLRKEIETIIEKLVLGFEKQLDALAIDDVIDVTSDIDVLESVMIRDGLLNNEFTLGR
ncbi:5-bromo-4-chloroindolyl phosphate hydrolysis family protein [Oscillibacter sp. GMB15532]|uniref:5-bromo-4-chloroindolyl phosphate hydrolysis family protein n=1 Tax=Oscillibacter sp. GMB15532 TaxID=3230022 RepID=UPI0034DE875D